MLSEEKSRLADTGYQAQCHVSYNGCDWVTYYFLIGFMHLNKQNFYRTAFQN